MGVTESSHSSRHILNHTMNVNSELEAANATKRRLDLVPGITPLAPPIDVGDGSLKNPCLFMHSGFLILITNLTGGAVRFEVSLIRDPGVAFRTEFATPGDLRMSYEALLRAGANKDGRKLKVRMVGPNLCCVVGPYSGRRFTALELCRPLQALDTLGAVLLRAQTEFHLTLERRRSERMATLEALEARLRSAVGAAGGRTSSGSGGADDAETKDADSGRRPTH